MAERDAVSQQLQSDVYRAIPLAAIEPGKFQPRDGIDDDALSALVESVMEQGVLQPILVRPLSAVVGDADFEIVAGERRWRAARLAGLKTIPAIVRSLGDQEALAAAIVENLQRENLSAIEVANSFSRLANEFSMTHNQVAKAVGRSRSTVSNYLRILELETEAKDLLQQRKIDFGHARALLALPADRQAEVARRIVARNLSVREVEKLASDADERFPRVSRTADVDTQTRWIQQQLAHESGTGITIRRRKDGSRTLGIEFESLPQLQEALRRIERLLGQVVDTAGPRQGDR